jgi:hypothetical protein
MSRALQCTWNGKEDRVCPVWRLMVGAPSAIKARLSGFEHFGKTPVIAGKILFEVRGAATLSDPFRVDV